MCLILLQTPNNKQNGQFLEEDRKEKGRQYGNTGCQVFKGGGYKIGKKITNQHTQRKLLNFEN